jgi:hypothetical protein
MMKRRKRMSIMDEMPPYPLLPHHHLMRPLLSHLTGSLCLKFRIKIKFLGFA